MNKMDGQDIDNPTEKIVAVSPIVKRIEALEFTDPEIPGEITVDTQGKLLKTYFELESVIGSHIETYDNWVTNVIKMQLVSRIFKIPRGEVVATNPVFFPPRISTSDDTWIPLTPRMARDNGYTYSSELYVDLILNKGTPQEEKIPAFLGRFPVMLGSVLCHLRGKTERERIEMGECPKDPLGYFIIKGAEKVILIQEKLRVNRIFIFNSTSKGDVVCKMTCNTIIGSSNVTIVKGKKNNALEIHLPFMGRSDSQTGKVGNTVSVFQIYRMLGVKNPNQILQMISLFTKRDNLKKIWVQLQPTFVEFAQVADDIEHIGKKKGLGDMDYGIKQASIMKDLKNELFTHIPPENLTQKLYMLSIMIARFSEYLIGVRKLDDRDNWGHKRLESAGRSLEQLFGNIWREVITRAQDSIDTKSLQGLQAVKREIDPSFVTDNFVSSFNANNWGVQGSYMGKENITDSLKRDAPLAVWSHLTKINTPTNRKAKQLKVRLVQMSQLGYVCVTGDTEISVDNNHTRKIKELQDGDKVLTVSAQDLTETPSRIKNSFTLTPKSLLEIRTISGRSIKCTPDHPFLVKDDKGSHKWVRAEKLVEGDLLTVKHVLKALPREPDTKLFIHADSISEQYRLELQKIGIVDRPLTQRETETIARLLGASITDGSIQYDGKYSSAQFNVGEEIDAMDLSDDIMSLGFGSPYIRRETSHFGECRHKTWEVSKNGSFASFLVAVGAFVGKKIDQARELPDWLINANLRTKRAFLSGFQGGDGGKITVHSNDKDWKISLIPTHQFSTAKYIKATIYYLHSIAMMFSQFEIVSKLNYKYSNDGIYDVTLEFNGDIENISRYIDNISYSYCYEKRRESHSAIEYIKYKEAALKPNCGNSLMKYDEFIRRYNDLEDKMAIPIQSVNHITVEPVYDFETVYSNHSFIANGFVTHNCPVETPEGQQCGLVKNTALTNYISIERGENIILEYISKYISNVPTEQLSNPLIINGKFLGWCAGESLRIYCVALRRKSIFYKDTAIVLTNDGFLYIYTDGARPTRPLLIVDPKTGELVIKVKNLWNADMKTLLDEGCVEYIDAFEQEYIQLAQSINNVGEQRAELEEAVRNHQEGVERLAQLEAELEGSQYEDPASDTLELKRTINDTRETVSQAANTLQDIQGIPPYTHSELDPTAILGIAASLIPLANHNQAPRNVYQCGMGKQALGIYHSQHSTRFDTTAKCMAYPTRPLFETQMNEVLGLNELPAGSMVIVAIMTYTGYNQEDALIMNQGAIDRGLFRQVIYKSYKNIQKRTRYTVEEFTRPEVRRGEPPERYASIDENGIARLGSFVRESDCIIGKVRTNIQTGKIENASTYLGVGQEGIVDRVLVSTNPEGMRVVKVKIRQIRKPVMGDKYASRHAQKATIGLILPEVDMPYTANGIRPDIIINPHCFTSDTPVSTGFGYSRPISSFSTKGSELVWGWNEINQSLEISTSMGMEPKGVKDIIQVYLEDGRIIKCTPDHRFLTVYMAGNQPVYRWIEAQNMVMEQTNGIQGTRVVAGLDMPLDNPEIDKNSNWSLKTAEYNFSMKTKLEREKSLSFARILGMVLTDGCISKRKDLTHGYTSTVCLGHKIDMRAFQRDIELITGVTPGGTFSKGVWHIGLPASLAGSVGKLDGVQYGRRTGQETSWPSFILDPMCPKSVLREFVGGLFGGDGHAPHIVDRSGIDGDANFLIQCMFSQTVMEDYLPNMVNKMKQLSSILSSLGVPSKVEGPFKVRYSATSYKPSDGIPRYEVKVKLETTTDFSDKIGFRYCIQKSCRLSAAAAYWRLQKNVRRQHDWVVNRTNEIYESWIARGYTNKKSLTALDMARKELIEREPILNTHYSLSNINDIRNRRSSSGSRKTLSRFDFPDVRQFFNSIGCLDWFTRKGTSPEYIIKRGSMMVPGYSLKFIGKRDAGKEIVYDIGVNNIHSFLAHGIVVHNCIPSRMTIAKMIEIVASKVAAFRGERINATAFRKFNIREFKENLRQYGYNPSGKERMYSGFTGKPLEAEIFIGPCYYQVLRHHVLDKIQMRARGAIKQLSHQPVSGRSRKGGQRFGEMERDAIISHGASAFLQERLCGVSDAYKAVYCATCGTIAIANHASDKFVCRTCGDDGQFGTCTIPYAYKLLTHMLAGAGFNLQFGMRVEQPEVQPLQLTSPQPLTSPMRLPQVGLPQMGRPTTEVPTIGLPQLTPLEDISGVSSTTSSGITGQTQPQLVGLPEIPEKNPIVTTLPPTN